MTPFARGLRKARVAHGFNQHDLAIHLDVSQVTISHWERGEEYPSLAHLAALGAVLPDVLKYAHEEELELLRRLMQAERIIFSGACSCQGCGCSA
jgi:transcriptional regulator with XRE-family HTH domain